MSIKRVQLVEREEYLIAWLHLPFPDPETRAAFIIFKYAVLNGLEDELVEDLTR